MNDNLLKVGAVIPDFAVPNQDHKQITRKDLRGKFVVFYFYPKDNTPGCTIESCDFSNEFHEFQNLNCTVYGISADDVASHQRFIAKKKLKLDLLADTEKELCQAFGVWQQKNMLGKKYMGIVRSTFLIDSQGRILYVWPKVKVAGHVKAVKEKLRELTKSDQPS